MNKRKESCACLVADLIVCHVVPFLAPEAVVFFGVGDDLSCTRAYSGDVLWCTHLGGKPTTISMSPNQSALVVGSDDMTLKNLSPTTGEVVWNVGMLDVPEHWGIPVSIAWPPSSKSLVVLTAYDSFILADSEDDEKYTHLEMGLTFFEAKSGIVSWQQFIGRILVSFNGPLHWDDCALACSIGGESLVSCLWDNGDHEVACICTGSGKVAWRSAMPWPFYNPPERMKFSPTDQYVAVSGNGGNVACLCAKSGEMLWRHHPICSPDMRMCTLLDHTQSGILIAYRFKDNEGIIAGWRLEILDQKCGGVRAGPAVIEQQSFNIVSMQISPCESNISIVAEAAKEDYWDDGSRVLNTYKIDSQLDCPTLDVRGDGEVAVEIGDFYFDHPGALVKLLRSPYNSVTRPGLDCTLVNDPGAFAHKIADQELSLVGLDTSVIEDSGAWHGASGCAR